jgi:hypothetical protein
MKEYNPTISNQVIDCLFPQHLSKEDKQIINLLNELKI